jgi:hypothetical protein
MHRSNEAMDNQHRLIEGYRDLTEKEIVLINAIKLKALELEKMIQSVKDHPGSDGRWLAIGQTHLQQGVMAVIRAVAKPGGF